MDFRPTIRRRRFCSGCKYEHKGKYRPKRFGVYFGSGVGGIICFSAEQTKLNESGAKPHIALFVPMMIAKGMASAHVAMKHNA